MSRRARPLDDRYLDEAGRLVDFERRQGDPPTPDSRGPTSHAQTWGSQRLLSRSSAGLANTRATVVEISDLGKSYPLNVQMRFAAVGPTGQPVLPWSPKYTDVSGTLTVGTRRGLGPTGMVTAETFDIDGTTGGNALPFDIVTARSFGVDVSLTNAAADVFVETIVTEVEDIATRNKILGWPHQSPNFFAASNVLQQFLEARSDRVQFIIVNTSTTGNLMVGFDAGVLWAPPHGSIVLPKAMFASYESPVGGWRGDVFGIWDIVGPDGGALVTEGTFF